MKFKYYTCLLVEGLKSCTATAPDVFGLSEKIYVKIKDKRKIKICMDMSRQQGKGFGNRSNDGTVV